MRTKLRVSLSDEIGAVAGCVDDNSPINYRLLAFRSACSASATRQLLATSSSPSFSGITLASGVKALGFEAVDAFGAVSLVCSPQFTVSDASVADISSLISSSTFVASLAGDAQGQQRFAANLAASLSSLYASNADASALSTIKESAFAFLNSSSSVIADSTAAAQTAATLFSLVTLPGSISPASSASALIMFQHIASSSLAMLSSGAASRDLAVEISSALVQGSALLLKGVSASSGRRLLGYKSGMESAMSAIVSAAKVQVHALASGQIAVVEDQSPSAVVGIRRLSSSAVAALVVPSSSSLAVSVSVAPAVDANIPREVGIAAVVLAASPFTASSSKPLLSPALNVVLFNPDSGAALGQERTHVNVVFPVTQASHDVRVVERQDGSRLSEQCVVYDGEKWTLACTVTPFASSTSSVSCACNTTQQSVAVALAEFPVDCHGSVGGSAVFDACRACGGSITDVSLCSPLVASSSFPVWAAIVIAVGSAVLIALGVFVVKVRELRRLRRTKPVTAIDILSKDKTLNSYGSASASFVTEFSPEQIPAVPEPPPRARPRPSFKVSRSQGADQVAPSASPSASPDFPNASPRLEQEQQEQQQYEVESTPAVAAARPPTHLSPRGSLTSAPPASPALAPTSAPASSSRPTRVRIHVPDGFTSSEDISPERRDYVSPPRVLPGSHAAIIPPPSISESSNGLPESTNTSRYVRLLQARLQAVNASATPLPSSPQLDSGAGVSAASHSPPKYDGSPLRVIGVSNGSNASRYSSMILQRAMRMQQQQSPSVPLASLPASPANRVSVSSSASPSVSHSPAALSAGTAVRLFFPAPFPFHIRTSS
jgi:hypothetical protein